jgi:hypothetical protein
MKTQIRLIATALLALILSAEAADAQEQPREVFTGSCPEPSSVLFDGAAKKGEILLVGETTPVKNLDDGVTLSNGLFKGWKRRILSVKVVRVYNAPGPLPSEFNFLVQYYSDGEDGYFRDGKRLPYRPSGLLGYDRSLLAFNRITNALASYEMLGEVLCHSTQGTRRH